jgi:hypothetical protein
MILGGDQPAAKVQRPRVGMADGKLLFNLPFPGLNSV